MPQVGKYEMIASEICEELSFTKPQYIGEGAFKEAYLTETPNKCNVALKIFNPDKCNLVRAEREITAMLQCNSPFIGKLHNWGKHKYQNNKEILYIIEEYFSGGTLAVKQVGLKGNTKEISNYAIALIEAVIHLRERALVHRDIKPDNIMFQANSNTPVLVDFGIVRDLTGVSLTKTFLPQGPGTPYYASPEQLNNEKHLIDWRSDQFSIGIVLGICLTGNHPYYMPDFNDYDVVNHVMNRNNCSPMFCAFVGEHHCDFLVKMISPWSINRYTHPYKLIDDIKYTLRS